MRGNSRLRKGATVPSLHDGTTPPRMRTSRIITSKAAGMAWLITLFLGLHLSLQAQYQPNWESLDKRSTPQWYLDAKFGIFIHWGLYSVPSYAPGRSQPDNMRSGIGTGSMTKKPTTCGARSTSAITAPILNISSSHRGFARNCSTRTNGGIYSHDRERDTSCADLEAS